MKTIFIVMPHKDAMHYTMEQLVKALAAETMSELSFDDAEVYQEDYYEINQPSGMWENIAKALLEEIEYAYSGSEVRPYGRVADECMENLSALVQPYSTYPAAPKLLSALENIASAKSDPRAYTSLVVRAMDSDIADNWFRDGRQYR